MFSTIDKNVTLPLIVVAGPTASGKSALALRLAEEFRGAVVNADSMQVYRELSILTARPKETDIARIPHYIYGVRPIAEPCSAALWRDMALEAIERVSDDERFVILCGGTGLYIRALVEGIAQIPPVPGHVRALARSIHARLGGAEFRAKLAERDPETAERLSDGDSQRLIRAWEVADATGRPISEWHRVSAPHAATFRTFCIVLEPEREILYKACDARFMQMIEQGLVKEVSALACLGLDSNLPGMKALGLPELMSYVRGEVDLETATAAAQQAIRRYAKRQITWFRHQIVPDMRLHAQFSESLEPKIFSKVRQFLLTGSS
ncbi:MAG: tRNA (adenosine(37)-N6)-dimethylallyltransferase MiaA [Rhodospirillaceae bacterium]|nr:tRNA (adenosine(37)-N6)-dimethylallyltransferase MiaA [Rhodospirillaceae bacterium]